MRKWIFLLTATVVVPMLHAQDDYDDIYYNPKNDNQEAAKTSKADKRQSNYIEDFGSVDVDDYNRRSDFYYTTAVDTIGQQTENAEDFVYTQQIQKFYNPTIVVDNSDVLADVLEDSYGNVNIVLDYGYPTFTSIYTGGYAWTPCHYNWCLTPSWTWSYGWGPFYSSWTWGPSWAWGPSWSYYDPYWGWGPSWSWGWGPSWGYYPPRPGWGYPSYRPSYSYHRNPGATRPTSAGSGWASNTRPGGLYNGGTGRGDASRGSSSSVSGTRQPGSSGTARPGHRNPGGNRGSKATISGTERWNISDRYQKADRVATERRIDGVTTNKRSSGKDRINTGTGRGYSTGKATTNRSYNTTTNNQRRSYNTTNNNTRRSYNTTTNSSRRSYNTTTNSNRSSGSSYRSGGGSRSYGGGGGHRGGGGTGRGRR